MMSDGYICTPGDLALSLNSSVPLVYCLTRGQSFGLLLNVESAIISLIAVTLIFVLLLYKIFQSAHRIQNPVDLCMFSLFMADLIQAGGMAMDAKWVNDGKVQTGTYCTAQGVLHQLGETGVAMSTLVIAIHTFAVVWCRIGHSPRQLQRQLKIAYIVLGFMWLFIILFIVIGVVLHTGHGNFYETPTPYWCWIGKQYPMERIVGQYLWLWLTLFVSILSYIPLFFWAQGYITVDPQRWWKFRFHKRIGHDAQSDDADRQSRRRSLGMIAYPLVYSVLVLPLSIVRWIGFSQEKQIPSVATFIVINIYALSGAFNALLLLWTRSGLFFSRNASVARAPVGQAPSGRVPTAKWDIGGSSADISLQDARPVDLPPGGLASGGVEWAVVS